MEKTFQFKFKIAVADYAKRFGIDIPDDSSDVITDDREQRDDGQVSHGDSEAQDAAINYSGQAATYNDSTSSGYVSPNGKTCKTPLEKCSAENPMTCRFHGVKAITTDIENTLRAHGVKGDVTVTILDVARAKNGQQIMSVSAEVKAQNSEEQAVKDAMEEFFRNPGVQGDLDDIGENRDEDGYESPFEMDILDPRAKAKWAPPPKAQPPTPVSRPKQPAAAAEQEQSPSSSDEPVVPTTKPTRKTVPTPIEPDKSDEKELKRVKKHQVRDGMIPFKFPDEYGDDSAHQTVASDEPELFPEDDAETTNPYTQTEMDWLKSVSDNIEKMARRVNERIDNSSTPVGTKGLKRFNGIDNKMLDDLASRDTVGTVKGLQDVYNKIRESEKNGWADRVLGDRWHPEEESTQYNDGTMGNLDFSGYRFDANKYGAPKTVGMSNELIDAIADSNDVIEDDDNKEHKKAAEALRKAIKDLSDIKDQLAALKPLKPVKSLYDAMRHKLGAAYYKADKAFKENAKKCADYASKLSVMKKTIAETRDALKKKGVHLVALDNWQKVEDTYSHVAWQKVSAHFGFDINDKDKYMKIFKRNMAAAAKKCTCFSIQGDAHVMKVLDGASDPYSGKPLHLNGNIESYIDAMNACHGCSVKRGVQQSRQHVQAYACTCDKDPKDIDEWYSGNSNRSGQGVGVVVKNNKVIKGIFNGCCSTKHKLKHHIDGSNVSFMNDCTCSAVMNNLKNISKDAFTKDLSGMAPNELWKAIGMTRQDPNAMRGVSTTTASNETWIIGGIGLDQIAELKFFHGVPKFTSKQKDNIKKNGIVIRDAHGNRVKI